LHDASVAVRMNGNPLVMHRSRNNGCARDCHSLCGAPPFTVAPMTLAKGRGTT
jgi:hypothetical protein